MSRRHYIGDVPTVVAFRTVLQAQRARQVMNGDLAL
jgi:hypothetical protein